MIHVDGSYGEGGGQILRTSASLAAITGTAVRIDKIRAGRAKPGLKAQHLTAIQAAMRVCNGHLEGAEVGASEVTMTPGSPVQAGHYAFDIGTAGSTALVFQALLLPLLLSEGESHISIQGGTHNTNAPSTDYLRHTFLRTANLGVETSVDRLGFFPKGGGTLTATFGPRPIAPIRRGEQKEKILLHAILTMTEALPASILDRAEAEIGRLAGKSGWPLEVSPHAGPSLSPGMAVHLDASYEGAAAGFSVLGRRGLPTERVVEEAWNALNEFDRTSATVDEHLADQLILPMLFANGPSEYRTSRVTDHLRTMAWLVPQFGVGTVTIDEAGGGVKIVPNRPTP